MNKSKKLFIFCLSSLLFSIYVQAQDVNVKGKVNDENGMPIPGATILIQGTSKGTTSDLDGNYHYRHRLFLLAHPDYAL